MIPRIKKFQEDVWKHYAAHKRTLPWRSTKDPYKILVSEMMLQQTQVERVKGYYQAFLDRFPDMEALAGAPLSDVLVLWKGLGYNRRAVNLKKTAEIIVANGVKFPKEYSALLALPGIGPSTAGALMNFSYGVATAFIETNIRSVFLHFFFKGESGVSDAEILVLVEKTMDQKNPREWYYALYDYGVMLKKTIGNPNARSKHYKKQSAFKGSNRELRAKILFYLVEKKKTTMGILVKKFGSDEERVRKNIEAFEKEGLISCNRTLRTKTAIVTMLR